MFTGDVRHPTQLPYHPCLRADAAHALLSRGPDAPGAQAFLSHAEACPECRRLVDVACAPARALPVGLNTLSPGDQVCERYQILRLLACGGMGEVYEAFDEVLDEVVALKTIVLSALDSRRALEALKAEVLLSRKVSHRNVCRILEFGVQARDGSTGSETIPFFTMELLRGETLRQLLQRRRSLSVEEAGPIVRQVMEGLCAIHAAGIVHRDLKPENVFLRGANPTHTPAPAGRLPSDPGSEAGEREGNRVVVMDFGLARSLDLPQSMASCADGAHPAGTLEYMAPEQLRGGRPTVSFDVYALGTIMFELLAGQRPFAGSAGGGTLATALARLDRPPPLLSSVLPGADPLWEQVIDRCLAGAPADRYASIEEVQQALFEPAAGREAGSGRWSRAIALAALLAGGLGATAAALGLRPPPEQGVVPLEVVEHTQEPPSPSPPAPPPRAPAAPTAPTATRAPVPPSTRGAPPSGPAPGTHRRVVRRTRSRAPSGVRAAASATAAASRPMVPPGAAASAASSRPQVATLIERAERLLSSDGSAACALGEEARSIAPATPAVYLFLGKCYMRLPDPARARRHYRKYLELAPDDPDAVFVRAIVGPSGP